MKQWDLTRLLHIFLVWLSHLLPFLSPPLPLLFTHKPLLLEVTLPHSFITHVSFYDLLFYFSFLDYKMIGFHVAFACIFQLSYPYHFSSLPPPHNPTFCSQYSSSLLSGPTRQDMLSGTLLVRLFMGVNN